MHPDDRQKTLDEHDRQTLRAAAGRLLREPLPLPRRQLPLAAVELAAAGRARHPRRQRPRHHRTQTGRGGTRPQPPGARTPVRGAGTLQPRPGAVRLRRVARPARTAADGVELHDAARRRPRRQPRRDRPPAPRLRTRRRDAHAATGQRPVAVFAGEPRSRREPAAGRLRSARRDRRKSDLHEAIVAARGDGDPRPIADGDRACGPSSGSCLRTSSATPSSSTASEPVHVHVGAERSGLDVAFLGRGQRHRYRPGPGRADLRGVQTAPHPGQLPGHRHRTGDLQEGRRAPRRAHLGRVAARRRRHVPVHTAADAGEQGDPYAPGGRNPPRTLRPGQGRPLGAAPVPVAWRHRRYGPATASPRRGRRRRHDLGLPRRGPRPLLADWSPVARPGEVGDGCPAAGAGRRRPGARRGRAAPHDPADPDGAGLPRPAARRRRG